MKGTVGSDKEDDMGPIIVVALTIVTLCWGVRMTAWRTVNARVRLAQGARCVAYGNGADWIVHGTG